MLKQWRNVIDYHEDDAAMIFTYVDLGNDARRRAYFSRKENVNLHCMIHPFLCIRSSLSFDFVDRQGATQRQFRHPPKQPPSLLFQAARFRADVIKETAVEFYFTIPDNASSRKLSQEFEAWKPGQELVFRKADLISPPMGKTRQSLALEASDIPNVSMRLCSSI